PARCHYIKWLYLLGFWNCIIRMGPGPWQIGVDIVVTEAVEWFLEVSAQVGDRHLLSVADTGVSDVALRLSLGRSIWRKYLCLAQPLLWKRRAVPVFGIYISRISDLVIQSAD